MRREVALGHSGEHRSALIHLHSWESTCMNDASKCYRCHGSACAPPVEVLPVESGRWIAVVMDSGEFVIDFVYGRPDQVRPGVYEEFPDYANEPSRLQFVDDEGQGWSEESSDQQMRRLGLV